MRLFSIKPLLKTGSLVTPLRSPLGSQTRLQLLKTTSVRNLFIRTVTTPNEDALKFLPSTTILPSSTNRTLEYLSGREAFNSPLARKLFQIDGVLLVMLGPDFVTVSKNVQIDWALLKPEIFAALSDFMALGEPVLDEDAVMSSDVEFDEDDDDVVAMIKELVFTRIRPAIQEDGGDIEFVRFDEDLGKVTIRLRGACRSCDSSLVTLKNGIEAMLMHYIEEVKSVVEESAEEEEVEAEAEEPHHLKVAPEHSKREEDVPPML